MLPLVLVSRILKSKKEKKRTMKLLWE